jgi:predicted ATP-dependent endonuclease of OLD family
MRFFSQVFFPQLRSEPCIKYPGRPERLRVWWGFFILFNITINEEGKMRISKIEIKNFRSIKEANLPLSAHICAIGPNNTGKSSFLMALSLFLSGNKLSPSDYYNRDENITITGWIEGVNEPLLGKLAEEHRDRIKDIVENDRIILIRKWDTSGKSSLFCMRKRPKEKKFHNEEVDKLMSGKRRNELKDIIEEAYPELQGKLEGISTQKDFKDLIYDYIKQLPQDQMEFVESPLPTGIDKSIFVLLPEPIYIPAVKDITDDIKTKETANFGKILRLLLDLISETEELKQVTDSFIKLKALLNKEIKEDGTVLDERLPQIQEVESMINRLLSEQFPNSNLDFEIPPPELKTVFSGARLFVDDGIRDLVETKGDGMKRAVTFALLRGFVELSEKKLTLESMKQENNIGSRYLILFEEPELYLHPKAQCILYAALGQISKTHQVCISTHSPYFLSPESTETFLRFQKNESTYKGKPPFTEIRLIDLRTDVSEKDAFQILCFENNNAAFFCDKVVLCEGDSDIIYLKHLSKTISTDWDFEKKNIGLIQIGGKGNFARYKEFFNCFGVPVQIISDLDALIDQFEGLGASIKCVNLRNALMNEVDALDKPDMEFTLSTDQAKTITGQSIFKAKYDRTKEIARKIAAGEKVSPVELMEFQTLFEKEIDYRRRKIICENIKVKDKKYQLINALRKEGINVLLQGSIEDYYPDGIGGRDKPTRALSACKIVKAKEDVFKLCDTVIHKDQNVPELQAIFDTIFENKAGNGEPA